MQDPARSICKDIDRVKLRRTTEYAFARRVFGTGAGQSIENEQDRELAEAVAVNAGSAVRAWGR
jgi:hypothetical protein